MILDWVPAHFPTDPHGLARFDGTALYEHADPRRGFHPDWNTRDLQFRPHARSPTSSIANALYWLERFHIDGLRVDAVASMLYLDYSPQGGRMAAQRHGGRENLEAIAFLRASMSSSTAASRRGHHRRGIDRLARRFAPVHHGGLGFGFKWNMGWMHDTLDYMQGIRSTAAGTTTS